MDIKKVDTPTFDATHCRWPILNSDRHFVKQMTWHNIETSLTEHSHQLSGSTSCQWELFYFLKQLQYVAKKLIQ
ncbi:hypothetical protein SK128_019395 [Halocaridina rubra]|uniref:Uncharacterized protein n=1 Tax=Halocaridina rubra TaxID=373956 RepID=A0AAN9A1F6_HALRR